MKSLSIFILLLLPISHAWSYTTTEESTELYKAVELFKSNETTRTKITTAKQIGNLGIEIYPLIIKIAKRDTDFSRISGWLGLTLAQIGDSIILTTIAGLQVADSNVIDLSFCTLEHLSSSFSSFSTVHAFISKLGGDTLHIEFLARLAFNECIERDLPQIIKSSKHGTEAIKKRARRLVGMAMELTQESAPDIPYYVSLLCDGDEDYRKIAVLALGFIGEKSIPELTKLLDDDNQEIRQWAAIAIAYVNERTVGKQYDKKTGTSKDE